jgi:hypothetical protein
MRKIIVIIILMLVISCSSVVTTEVTTSLSETSISTEQSTTNDISEVTEMTSEDNQFQEIIINQTETLNASKLFECRETFSNLKFQDGGIYLLDNSIDGEYISQPLLVEHFQELVMSWNAEIDEFSKITFSIAIGNETGFSDFFVMGYWTDEYKYSFANQEDEFGSVNIDVLKPKIDNVNRIKLKILIKATSNDATKIKNISLTMKQLDRAVDINEIEWDESANDVPRYAQMGIPSIGSRICSPTSLAMILGYYGYNELPVDVATSVYDRGAGIYGNWSFNVSYAGGKDNLISRVEYISDLQVLNDYLVSGVPLALSIKTTDKSQLNHSLMAYSSGHLVVLTGIKFIDGEWYGITNDPAEYTEEAVQRQYLLSELLDAWKGYAYVVQME